MIVKPPTSHPPASSPPSTLHWSFILHSAVLKTALTPTHPSTHPSTHPILHFYSVQHPNACRKIQHSPIHPSPSFLPVEHRSYNRDFKISSTILIPHPPPPPPPLKLSQIGLRPVVLSCIVFGSILAVLD